MADVGRVTLFMGDFGLSHTQSRTVDEVKNKRRHRRLRPERQREQAMAGHHRKLR